MATLQRFLVVLLCIFTSGTRQWTARCSTLPLSLPSLHSFLLSSPLLFIYSQIPLCLAKYAMTPFQSQCKVTPQCFHMELAEVELHWLCDWYGVWDAGCIAAEQWLISRHNDHEFVLLFLQVVNWSFIVIYLWTFYCAEQCFPLLESPNQLQTGTCIHK